MRIMEWLSDEKKIKVTGNLRPRGRKTICSGSLKHRSYGEVKRGLIYFKPKQKKPTKQEQQQHKNKQTKQNTKAHTHTKENKINIKIKPTKKQRLGKLNSRILRQKTGMKQTSKVKSEIM